MANNHIINDTYLQAIESKPLNPDILKTQMPSVVVNNIGNLTEQDIRDHFSQNYVIYSVKMRTDSCIVVFYYKDEAKSAAQIERYRIGNTNVSISLNIESSLIVTKMPPRLSYEEILSAVDDYQSYEYRDQGSLKIDFITKYDSKRALETLLVTPIFKRILFVEYFGSLRVENELNKDPVEMSLISHGYTNNQVNRILSRLSQNQIKLLSESRILRKSFFEAYRTLLEPEGEPLH